MSEKPEECQCCGFQTERLRKFVLETTIAGSGKVLDDVQFWFCDLCSGSGASTYHRYPNQTPSNTQILRAICFVGNSILEALKKT